MTGYRHLTSLGSSFAAGPGISPVVDWRAGRSANNYAALLARRLDLQLTDLTVSGATTSTILREPQRAFGRTFLPQIVGVPADTDLVTITAGGNDLEYLGGLVRAAAVGRLLQAPVSRPGRHALGRFLHLPSEGALPAVRQEAADQARDGLVAIVRAVRERAPQARVVLVDYLSILTDDTVPGRDVALDQEQIAGFRRVAALLVGAFRSAAAQTGADLVRPSEVSRGHGLGSRRPWVHGLRPLLPASFHPNAAGMTAVADVLEQHLRSRD